MAKPPESEPRSSRDEGGMGLCPLEREFDQEVERMQAPRHHAATDALFRLSGREIGELAVREDKANQEGR